MVNVFSLRILIFLVAEWVQKMKKMRCVYFCWPAKLVGEGFRKENLNDLCYIDIKINWYLEICLKAIHISQNFI